MSETKEAGGMLRRVDRWSVRLAAGAATLLLVLAALGGGYQAAADARDARRFPPPGERVDVGGLRLHLHEMGSGHAGPTVILEAGGGSFSAQWGWIQPAVADFARVVAYDRPGLGWSDASPEPLDGTRIAEHLRAALQARGIPGPYIHVGHSVGSPLGRAFAQRFPGEVAGMVKVDPRHLRTEAVLGDVAVRQGETMKRWLPVLARLGIPRLLNSADGLAGGLPPRQRAEGIAFFASTAHLSGTATEWDMGNRTTDALEASGENYGDTPIVILSSGQPDFAFDQEARRRFTAAQIGMTNLSTRSEHRVVEGADHYTIVTEREHATEVVRAIRDVLERARPPAVAESD